MSILRQTPRPPASVLALFSDFSGRAGRPRVLRPLVLTALLSAFAWPVLAAAPFVVNSTGDKTDKTKGDGICADADGNCTLRAAIEESNALAGVDTINFAIPGAGVHTITPLSVLPSQPARTRTCGSPTPAPTRSCG